MRSGVQTMNYRTLTTAELITEATYDKRYRTDALFTQLVDRLEETSAVRPLSPPRPVGERLDTILEVPHVR